MPLAVGTQAPDFSLQSDSGEVLSLASLRGKRVLLFCYPKDGTSGCTAEACEFGERYLKFRRKKVTVLGISPDSVKKHQKFKATHQLPYPLLADPTHETLEAYDVWREKSMYGQKYWGVERTTYLIDEAGLIIAVWQKVKPEGHAEEVHRALKALLG